MKIGLVSCRSENGNTAFNLSQIERFLKLNEGRADLLCFGEAFLQGFDALSWNYESDRNVAVTTASDLFQQLKNWTVEYQTALLLGYLERDQESIYSSCAVIDGGKIIHNYRRISRGWKEYTRTDQHYREGDDTAAFLFRGRKMMIALCGDLWDQPERFRTDGLLIWPVYLNYSLKDWQGGLLKEYAEQAGRVCEDVLMVNPLDRDPISHGGAFRFQKGKMTAGIPFDEEMTLIVEVRN
ncbi:MAG: carbon-nitrogen hydrolase family protein [Erysipelotrichaceae bacterium]|nr:carbon-nitrogen hydrolase family protein [Erysipelotrichaceae bacterium]